MFKAYTSFLFLVFLSFTPESKAQLDEYDLAPELAPSPQEGLQDEYAKHQNKFKESWFFLMSFGFGEATYPINIQNQVDTIEDLSGGLNLMFGFDAGLYFPIDTGLIWGGVLSSVSDIHENKNSTRRLEKIRIEQNSQSISLIYFTDGHIGQGLFLRGDYGASLLRYKRSLEKVLLSKTSSTGNSYALKIGYGARFDLDADFMVQLGYTVRKFSAEEYKTTLVSIILFL